MMRWLAAVLPALVVQLLAAAAPVSAAPDPVGRWPLSPVPPVVAGFDPPSAPWAAGHRGVDLLGSVGQPVRAALPGTVSFSGSVAGRGVVTVDHGGTRTTYQPVVDRLERGSPVEAGDVIGRLAVAGSHCFPRACLHWGWLQGSTYLDPLALVGMEPVRLLPLSGLARGPVAQTWQRQSPNSRAFARWSPVRDWFGWRGAVQARGCACW